MQRENVQSSNIKSVGYNPIQRKLEVEFKSGEVYRYKSVPRNIHNQMMSSGSKGSFLHHHIKFKYPYRKYKDRDGDFVRGEWNTLEKPVKKTAFDEMFLEYIEKIASGGKQIYHLSEKNLDGVTIHPRVPDNSLTKGGHEDGSTPRISFSTSVGGALTGISNNLSGKTFYIHVPETEIEHYKPTIGEVPDVRHSHEVWAKEPVKLKLHKKIVVTSAQDKPLKYVYGNNEAKTYKWNYNYVPTTDKKASGLVNELFEKLARAKFTKDEAEAVLKKLGVDISKEKWAIDDFVNGMNVELEHGTQDPATNVTDDAAVTTAKIALAHLNEFHGYYKALDKMEADLRKKEKTAFDLGFDVYIEKLAVLNDDVELYPHQKRVVDSPETSKIIAHSVGGGKTLTAIAKFEKMKQDGKANRALVVVPAGLRENFHEKGVQQFTNSKSNIVGTKQEQKSKLYGDIDPNADYNIMSYEIYRKDPARAIQMAKADTVISDEAHKGKNEGTLTTEQLKKYRPLYKNHISLTGSLVSNSVSDVQPLVEVVSGGRANVGKSKDEFERMYVQRDNSKKYQDVKEKRRPITGFRNPRLLGSEFSKYIDFADYDDLKHIADMPEKKVAVKKIPLSKEQAKMYKRMLHDDPAMMKLIKEKRLETLKDDEVATAFNKLIEERKLMNSVGSVVPGISLSESAKITPKTRAVLDNVDQYLKTTPDGEVLIMSHLINGGTNVVEQGLQDRGIEYGTFLGKGNKGVTEASRQQAVRDYNDHKKRVMIISDAGGEGLSLNDTTYEAVLDPHFNPERMKQMEARGIRSGGLKGRDDRTVYVDRYLATMPKTLGIFPSKLKTPDEFIYNIQENKDGQNQKLYQLLRQYQ
jgi:SNF2 family DNA or RNA helicase